MDRYCRVEKHEMEHRKKGIEGNHLITICRQYLWKSIEKVMNSQISMKEPRCNRANRAKMQVRVKWEEGESPETMSPTIVAKEVVGRMAKEKSHRLVDYLKDQHCRALCCQVLVSKLNGCSI